VLALSGRNTGTPDMTPTAIKAEGAKAGLKDVSYPTSTVAGQSVDTGSEARCFAQYMNIHTLEATGGYTYSEMGRYQAKPDAPKSQLSPGGGTSNTDYAVTDAVTGQPVPNGARNVWVTEAALSTALNTSYMATQLSLFSLVVGIALFSPESGSSSSRSERRCLGERLDGVGSDRRRRLPAGSHGGSVGRDGNAPHDRVAGERFLGRAPGYIVGCMRGVGLLLGWLVWC
jgi:hypothetical protein